MHRFNFPLDLSLSEDNSAYKALLEYERALRPEIVRRWMVLAKLNEPNADVDVYLSRFPLSYTDGFEKIQFRCQRNLPESDPLHVVCCKAVLETQKRKELYLRGLFLTGKQLFYSERISNVCLDKQPQQIERTVTEGLSRSLEKTPAIKPKSEEVDAGNASGADELQNLMGGVLA